MCDLLPSVGDYETICLEIFLIVGNEVNRSTAVRIRKILNRVSFDFDIILYIYYFV